MDIEDELKKDNIDYEDLIQVDGAFASNHLNYGEAPEFNGARLEINQESTDDLTENLNLFIQSTDLKDEDNVSLRKEYWYEYMHAFIVMRERLPNSVVTAFIGRHSIELGLKHLILLKSKEANKTHNLGDLAQDVFKEYHINSCNSEKFEYMKDVDTFCSLYMEHIEGNCPEYFRYSEYKDNNDFGGIHLSIGWISYNWAIITAKLLHMSKEIECRIAQIAEK